MAMIIQSNEGPTTGKRQPLGERDVLCRLEGVLRSVTPAQVHGDGVRFEDELDARIVAGPFAAGSLTGLEQFTVASDGTVRLRGSHVLRADDGVVSLELRGLIVLDVDTERPRPGALEDGGSDFPDLDLPISGSGLMHSSGPGFARFDGVPAAVEGWLNFASGELELEAYVM